MILLHDREVARTSSPGHRRPSAICLKIVELIGTSLEADVRLYRPILADVQGSWQPRDDGFRICAQATFATIPSQPTIKEESVLIFGSSNQHSRHGNTVPKTNPGLTMWLLQSSRHEISKSCIVLTRAPGWRRHNSFEFPSFLSSGHSCRAHNPFDDLLECLKDAPCGSICSVLQRSPVICKSPRLHEHRDGCTFISKRCGYHRRSILKRQDLAALAPEQGAAASEPALALKWNLRYG